MFCADRETSRIRVAGDANIGQEGVGVEHWIQVNVFYEFALLLTAAGALGFVANWLKQPLIVAFIAVGVLVGPAGLKWVTIGSEIDLLAKTGIALLLFTVGSSLDLQVIRTMGPVSLATGLGQVHLYFSPWLRDRLGARAVTRYLPLCSGRTDVL